MGAVISDDVIEALLEQLNGEFQSANLYLAMSAYCSHTDFNGATSWLRSQYEEEQQHALKIYDYLIDQDVHVVIGQLKAPNPVSVRTGKGPFGVSEKLTFE